MTNILATFLTIIGLASTSNAHESIFKVGDCWSYVTRPGEEGSFIVIRKIELPPKTGTAIHISVFGLKIKNPLAPKGFTVQVGHLPISGDSLKNSLREKIQKEIPEINWDEGYKTWREAKGGVFTKPVKDCIGYMEEAINHKDQG